MPFLFEIVFDFRVMAFSSSAKMKEEIDASGKKIQNFTISNKLYT